MLAAETGYLDGVNLAIFNSEDPSADNNYTIRWAARNGHVTVVDRLLKDLRVDPSAIDNEAIRLAARDGHVTGRSITSRFSR